jgi:hypothetical protein
MKIYQFKITIKPDMGGFLLRKTIDNYIVESFFSNYLNRFDIKYKTRLFENENKWDICNTFKLGYIDIKIFIRDRCMIKTKSKREM